MKQYKLGDKVKIRKGIGFDLQDPIRFDRAEKDLTGVVNRQVGTRVGLHINGKGIAIIPWDLLERIDD